MQAPSFADFPPAMVAVAEVSSMCVCVSRCVVLQNVLLVKQHKQLMWGRVFVQRDVLRDEGIAFYERLRAEQTSAVEPVLTVFKGLHHGCAYSEIARSTEVDTFWSEAGAFLEKHSRGVRT